MELKKTEVSNMENTVQYCLIWPTLYISHLDGHGILYLLLIQFICQFVDEMSDALLELAVFGGVDESVDTEDEH